MADANVQRFARCIFLNFAWCVDSTVVSDYAALIRPTVATRLLHRLPVKVALNKKMMEQKLILIVEDDEKSRRLLADVLSHQGYDVAETDNAEDGLEVMRNRHPDLVLMDIHLPGMSGLDALRVLRAEEGIKGTKIVAVTASVMGNDRDKIKAAGFDGFEPKPINLKAFLATVKTLIALPAAG